MSERACFVLIVVDGLQHAVGYVTGDRFYGAKASLNVWSAKVASPAEFSLSQIWVISGSFGNDLNTIEAGWQVSPTALLVTASNYVFALPYVLTYVLLEYMLHIFAHTLRWTN
jgi:hypothetical protein